MTLPDGASLGAILVDNGHERKVYVGIGSGVSEEADAQHIRDHGAKMYPETWIPFLSKAYPKKIDKFCSKCGVELAHPPPVSCIGCGVHINSVNTSTDPTSEGEI